ncbi:hypothetical protein FOMPIDRAFT_1045338 [Fomitopsis schrenkii]|uniref:Uncharacterized protein n=1 Tax=Fomitopsis schrenkii TaxID=2126942 RepID=S8EJI0_FOMSC|nr:hypothetical protein FOMPIDRAFT_1045338 [Fomitopsis schrenkii]
MTVYPVPSDFLALLRLLSLVLHGGGPTVSPTPPSAFSPAIPLALHFPRPPQAAVPSTLPMRAQPTPIIPVRTQTFHDVRFMLAGNPPEPPIRPRNPIAAQLDLVQPELCETFSQMSAKKP